MIHFIYNSTLFMNASYRYSWPLFLPLTHHPSFKIKTFFPFPTISIKIKNTKMKNVFCVLIFCILQNIYVDHFILYIIMYCFIHLHKKLRCCKENRISLLIENITSHLGLNLLLISSFVKLEMKTKSMFHSQQALISI